MSQIKNLKQSFLNQLSKTGKTVFDSAIRYKKDKKDLFLSYFEYTLTLPKKFDKYIDITKTGFKNFITKSQSKTFVYNLGWRYPENKNQDKFNKFHNHLPYICKVCVSVVYIVVYVEPHKSKNLSIQSPEELSP